MHFPCDGTLYEQFYGVAMGSSRLVTIGDIIYMDKINKKLYAQRCSQPIGADILMTHSSFSHMEKRHSKILFNIVVETMGTSSSPWNLNKIEYYHSYKSWQKKKKDGWHTGPHYIQENYSHRLTFYLWTQSIIQHKQGQFSSLIHHVRTTYDQYCLQDEIQHLQKTFKTMNISVGTTNKLYVPGASPAQITKN